MSLISPGAIFSVLLLIYPVVVFLFLSEETRRRYHCHYYIHACELGIATILGWYCISKWKTSKKTILPLLFFSFFFFAIAEFGFENAFLKKSYDEYSEYIYFPVCYSLSMGLMAVSLIIHFRVYAQPPVVIFGILAIGFFYFLLQYRYLVQPLHSIYYPKRAIYIYDIIIYGICSSVIAGISSIFSLRTLNLSEHIFLNLMMALLACDFAATFHLFNGSFDHMRTPQCFWFMIIAAIFLVFFISWIRGKMLFSEPGILTDWLSIRVSFGLLIFAITIFLLLGLSITRFFAIKHAVDVTVILTIVILCWSLSNILSFNISSKFMEIGTLMGTNRVGDIGLDGSPGIQLKKINKTIFFSSEMNFIIDQYNQMADKFNLRGKKIVEKDAVRGHLASQMAHDIESPLSAIRTIITLPHLDTDAARETLWTALASITDMVNRLRFRSEDVPSTGLTVYSVAAALEKVFKMKKAEFSELKTVLQLNIEKNAVNTFFKLDLDSFRSALSNIINNSKDEVIKKGGLGEISINLNNDGKYIYISVLDNGVVLSDDRIRELNDGVYQSTKHSENPLGIASSRRQLSKYGGSLHFSKRDPIGMKAIIQLPVHHPPEWIATEINLLDAKNLVIFDDDESVHQAVKIRVLSNAQLSHLRLISCCNERHFEDFLASEDFESTLFLIDYEFRGNSKTGIDYINRFRINRYSILVTSHWDEQKVINESKLAHVPIFPKGLMDSVRFITEPKQEVDFVLIDDNPIVRFAWKTAANSYGLNYRMFSNPAYFQMHCRGLSVHSKIFIDFHFSDTTGLQLLQELEGEFYNYFMLTGEDQENIPNSIFLDRKRIIFSKQFPGHLFVKKANSSELGKAT